MRNLRLLPLAAIVVGSLLMAPGRIQAAGRDTNQPGFRARAVVVFDAKEGSVGSDPVVGDAWRKIETGQTPPIRGDAVLANDRLVVVLRRRGGGAELYAQTEAGSASRAKLVPLTADGQMAGAVEKLELIENGPAGAAVRAAFKTAGGGGCIVDFRLGRGDSFVESRPGPGGGADRLRIEAPCRFAILPDFFADDVVIDATQVPAARAELPSENFLLHLAGAGEAIVLAVAESRDREMEIALAGAGAARRITASEVCFGANAGKDDRVWTAVLGGPGVWHAREVAPADAGQIVKLDWVMPYPAAWRADFTQTEGLTDSWEMVAEQPDGRYAKTSWLGGSSDTVAANRERWTTVLGTFKYPCWIGRDGRGFFQPLKSSRLTFLGPAVVYAANRVDKTPPEAVTVVDVMRQCLGVGPCEYVLDVEGQRTKSRGKPTCATRDALAAIYGPGQQKAKRTEVEKLLVDVVAFVQFIRARIDGYVRFGHEIRAYLAEQAQAHPPQRALLEELDRIAARLDARLADRRARIQTPEYAVALVEDFRKSLLDYEGPDAAARVKKFAEALVVVGSNQDHLVGECRWAIKALRQRAALAMAQDPAFGEIAREIRTRTQKALRNPAGHEAPRH